MPPKTREMQSVPDAEELLKRKYVLVDFDALDCPICTEPLSSPVFQCRNGDIACSQCCVKLTKGCPSCSKSIGHIRCFAIERIVESVRLNCKHALQGCKEMLKYSERELHENILCKCIVYRCPSPYCKHEAPMADIPEHITKMHRCENVTVRLDLSNQVVKFQINLYRFSLTMRFYMVQAKEALFLVYCGCTGPDFEDTFLLYFSWSLQDVVYSQREALQRVSVLHHRGFNLLPSKER